MISKELLSEVLGFFIDNCWNDGDLIVWREDGMSEINIYELAHKCKEWAFDKGFELFSRIVSNDHQPFGNCLVIRAESDPETVLTIKNANTEPEATFKACEWILKEMR